MVCHGNLNRSPLAAAVLDYYAGCGLRIKSAGFFSEGEPANPDIIDYVAQPYASRLKRHRSQYVTLQLLTWAGLIVFMDNNNESLLQKLIDDNNVPTHRICLAKFLDKKLDEIPDPGFMEPGTPEFGYTIELIEEAARNLANELIDP